MGAVRSPICRQSCGVRACSSAGYLRLLVGPAGRAAMATPDIRQPFPADQRSAAPSARTSRWRQSFCTSAHRHIQIYKNKLPQLYAVQSSIVTSRVVCGCRRFIYLFIFVRDSPNGSLSISVCRPLNNSFMCIICTENSNVIMKSMKGVTKKWNVVVFTVCLCSICTWFRMRCFITRVAVI